MTSTTLAGFLNPEGFDRPRVTSVLREASVVGETGRYALRSLGVRIERGLGNKAQAQHYAQRLKTEYPQAAQTKELLESERNPG